MSLDTSQRRLTAGEVPDPSNGPATVERSAAQMQAAERHRQRVRAAWEAFREDVEYMAATGETIDGCARRMGVTTAQMFLRFRRWGVPVPTFPGDYALAERGESNPITRVEARGGSRLARTN